MTGTTLKEISKALGISISTVSRALKNHPDISSRTKTKVAELANLLDYEPNANAIGLRTNTNKVFGLLIPSISNSFYDSFVAAVEEESRKVGYSIMILQSGDNAEIEVENLKLCRQNRVSGVFVCIASQTQHYEPFNKIKEQKIPLIFFDKVPDSYEGNKVCLADKTSAVLSANTIIQSGKKSVLAFFGNEKLSITAKRVEAFKDCFKNKKIKLETQFCNSMNEVYPQTLSALNKNQKPDAIFCMSDEILCGVMKAVLQLKLTVGKDVSVIAISDGFFPKIYAPEITYVETSGYKLGKAAFTRMMECINDNSEIKEIIIDSVLIQGASI
ncbi:MAG: hypothetical protein C0459_11375 [Chitinophaga sp.]|jgi:LacI family transcriptional regulator|nr:hypothetical protein [Chitinophaga sp.]